MTSWPEHIRTYADAHQLPVAGGAAVGLIVLGFAVWKGVGAVRRAFAGRAVTALITVAAVMATVVQSTGMWRFFADTMHLPLGLRIFLFCFLEIALLASGLRARELVKQDKPAGFDGAMVWALALLSGVMSATDATSFPEVLIRLLVPLVVATLWERDLLAAKLAARGTQVRDPEKVRWRLSFKELAVKLGLADAADSTIAGLDANRRIDRYMRAADRVESLEGKTGRAAVRAGVRMAKAQGRLERHARLHGDPTEVMAMLGEQGNAKVLARLGVAKEDPEVAVAREGLRAAEERIANLRLWAKDKVLEVRQEAQVRLDAEREKATAAINEALAGRGVSKESAEALKAELTAARQTAAELEARVRALQKAADSAQIARTTAEARLESEAGRLERLTSQFSQESSSDRARIAELERLLFDVRGPMANGVVVPPRSNGVYLGPTASSNEKKAAFLARALELIDEGDDRLISENRNEQRAAGAEIDKELGLELSDQTIRRYITLVPEAFQERAIEAGI